jgi:hypothetical protein
MLAGDRPAAEDVVQGVFARLRLLPPQGGVVLTGAW